MKKTRIFFYILLFLVLGISVSWSQSGNVGPRGNFYDDPSDGIYVSPSGNDVTATGSIDAPFKSINTALNAALNSSLSSATIILRGGTYQEKRDVRVRMSNVTIKSAKGEWAVIDLTIYDPGNDQHSGVLFYAKDEKTGGIVKDCKLQCVEVKGGFYTVCFETTWEWGEAYPDRKGASNIIVEDCILHHSTDDAVKVKPGCEHITIRYNEIHNSGQRHAHLPDFNTGEHNAEGIDNVNGDGMHVHNNYIHDICSTGIYAKGGATNVIIENNIIEQAYAGGIMLGFDTSPQYFDIILNPEYYENINGIARNNLIINAGWEGIGLYASKDAQIYNNTIINAVSGPLNYHSPIYFGVATQDWENFEGCPPNINPNIHNNIVYQPSTYYNRMIDIRFVKDFYDPVLYPGLLNFDLSSLDGNPTMDYNCYFNAGKSATFTDNRPPAVTNMELLAWKEHINNENNSIEIDPNFDNNYMPSNSQCAGMGILYPLIINEPIGMSESYMNQNIMVYPNPTSGKFSVISFQLSDVSSEMSVVSIEILDFAGRIVHREPCPVNRVPFSVNRATVEIDISHLPAGIYFVKVGKEIVKVVKK
ncbi:MAG: right-handed parallel beta-helix repeat-containing protein [Marinilabiliaceae bacterium]|nr:right-handed parallel beta-helix repeat-containing protein [Marinilabiliaceae bacterium]